MNKGIIIRKGKLSDVDQVEKLWLEMMEYHQELSSHDFDILDEGPEFFKKYYKTNVRSKNRIALVAEFEGILVGYLLGSKEKRPPVFKTKYHGFLSDLAVTKGKRKKGIGTLLIDQFKLWMKEKGLDYVLLHVDANNEPALNFYDKLDFETIVQVKKKIV